jgi:hypothetical protein
MSPVSRVTPYRASESVNGLFSRGGHPIGRSVGRHIAIVIYVLALVGVVVGVDVLFFRHHVWARLLGNIGIVLVFAAFYLRFQSALGGKTG